MRNMLQNFPNIKRNKVNCDALFDMIFARNMVEYYIFKMQTICVDILNKNKTNGLLFFKILI